MMEDAFTRQLNQKIALAKQNNSLLVGVNVFGNKTPVFFSSSILWYKHIIPYVNKEQPLYFFEPAATEDIAEIVKGQIQEISKVQPDGPYILVGFCQSAYITYEVAAALQHSGKKDIKVIIIESSTPAYESDVLKKYYYAMLGERLRILLIKRPKKILKDVKSLHPSQRANFLSRKIKHVVAARTKVILRKQVASSSPHTLPGYDVIRFPNHKFSVFKGKIVIVKASEQSLFDKYDPYFGWAAILGAEHINVHVVEGAHSSIFFPPLVQNLATVLNMYFN